MNYQEPLKISEIDLSKIIYTKPQQTHNKKIILIKYESKNKNFVFQTPSILSIGKIVKYNDYQELELVLEGKQENKINKFIKLLNNLETQIKEDAQYNASKWFESDILNFQKIIRESDIYKNGTIKIKILKTHNFETILQDESFNKIESSSIPENAWCKMILEVYAIWVHNNEFGIFLRPIIISFTPRKELYNYKFIESEEEIDEIPDTETNSLFISNNSIIKLELSEVNFSESDDDDDEPL